MLVTNNYYFCRTTIHSNLILDHINVTNSSESASPGADEDPQDHSDIETINQQSDSCSESDSEVTNAASKVDFGPSSPCTSNQDSDLIRSGDFGKVVNLKACRNLTDEEKYYLLKHHFIPAQNYKFPPRHFSGRPRFFQNNWLSHYNGLVYSESDNGGIVNIVCYLVNVGLQ